MKTTRGEICEFLVTIGLHQGSTLSLSLLALIMDGLIAHIQEELHWCMLFVDDMVLVDESTDDVNAKLEKRGGF